MFFNTTILLVFLLILFGVGVLFVSLFVPDILYWRKARKIRKTERTSSEPSNSLNNFESDLRNASVRMIESGEKIAFPALRGDTFMSRARYFYKTRKREAIDGGDESAFHLDWSECGWIVYALAEDYANLQYISRVYSEKILPLPLKMINHSQLGMVALLLFEKTANDNYKIFADKIYSFIRKQDSKYGVLYRQNIRNQIVDVVGMAVPFLIKYGMLFSDEEALKLAEKTVSQYIKYGCDRMSGMPAFAFQLEAPHIKCGATNWGRGCAWFVIGLSYVNINNFDNDTQSMIDKLDSSLVKLWETDGFFGHFISQGPRDLSAELPIVYYLYKKRLINIEEHQLLSYSTMCHNGIMYNSSSENHGIISYGMPCGPNALSQAYMIRLINLYKEMHPKYS